MDIACPYCLEKIDIIEHGIAHDDGTVTRYRTCPACLESFEKRPRQAWMGALGPVTFVEYRPPSAR